MDRRKIHKQLAKKIELQQTLTKPRDTFSGGQLNELNIKPSSTKSGAGGNANDFIQERPPKFSLSTTNLKIKKAHATTLSDFFSQQREQTLGLKKPQQPSTAQIQSRLVYTSDNKQQREYFKKSNTEQLLNQNPMNFYHRNSNAIVQQILKMSENQVLYSMSRNNIQSSHNYSQSNQQEDSPEGSNNNIKPSTSTYPNSSIRNANQLNPLRNLTGLGQNRPTVHFQVNEGKLHKQQQELRIDTTNLKNSEGMKEQGGSTQKYSSEQVSSQGNFLPSTVRSNSTGQNKQRMPLSRLSEKKRNEILYPKKFYCLSSVGFKNYKYPRPFVMPYEKESEKLTRMPLYLLPQSAPSKEIEDICINKYQTEVQELESSIVEKQQTLQQPSQNNDLGYSYENQTLRNGDYFQLQNMENMKAKYQNEINYLQNKASSLSKKRKFKSNAKYTFSDSKSKDLNSINMRSNRIEDISDALFRSKNKVEEQISKTRANITRLHLDNSSLMQQSITVQNKMQINQTIQQLYRDLVEQSDQLKSNHKYTEDYRQKLEEDDEEGVAEDEYQDYDENEENFDSEEIKQQNHKKKNSSSVLQQKGSGTSHGGAYIQEETEEEFQNENSTYKIAENQLQDQINAQEEYINRYINNNANSAYNTNSDEEIQIPSYKETGFNGKQFSNNEEEQPKYHPQSKQKYNEHQQQENQHDHEEEEDDQIRIHSLADFKNTQPLTDKDIIKKPQLGQLMMNVLVDTFTILKFNKPALKNRILLSLGLNPQDVYQSVSKDTFRFFYEVLVSKTATPEMNIKFIIKFFKLDDDEEEEEKPILESLKDNNKRIIEPEVQTKLINKDEFKRILRILTISIDEKTKNGDKSLYDYMIENLTLTEVIKPAEQNIDLDQFQSILSEGKINPKDIIDLICNLQ